jgi:hypothetical protein
VANDVSRSEFVGAGWAFPPDVGPSGGVALVTHEREIEQAIRIILGTHPGERPMRPGFGCPLRDFVFRNADISTAAELSFAVQRSIQMWEPRVDVLAVDVRPARDVRNRLNLDITYQIKNTNDPRNLVYPFYTIPVHVTEF